MSDLISRQAAIDVAKEELDNGTFYDIPSKIEYLPSAQPEPRWIPCSERLPEAEGIYLVTVDKECLGEDENSVFHAYWIKGYWHYDFFEKRKYTRILRYIVGRIDDIKIIAWMPLPEPYKEGADE